jgi:DNA-binding winged helix-turn-helix (wHTH) protein/tetratricopeptide (TPR) repeat protein
MAGREVYGFAEFTLDVSERRFSRAGQDIPLAPKVFELLLALIRHGGGLVTKRELLDAVWPDSFVEEGILAVHISALRKTLGAGEGGQRYIETVSRAGYRFKGTITRQNGPADAVRSPQVYELFGCGRRFLLAYSMFDIPKAIEAFEAAAELDPSYAAAHAGLALAYCAQAAMRAAPPLEAYGKAKAAALHALAMDPSCADAQAALGAVLFFSEWKWAAAERSLLRALEINPNHTEACLLHGQLLEVLGRLEAGLAMKQKALEREPQSPLVHLQISMSYWHQRRYDQAIEWASKTLALDTKHPHAREHLAGAYLKTGDFDSYLAENIKHAELHGVPAKVFEPIRQAYAAEGLPGVRRFFLARAAHQPDAFPAMQLAMFYGEAGNHDVAFQHLERAITSHDPSLVHLAVAPQWDSLRDDTRFARCLVRMGLVDYFQRTCSGSGRR